LVEASRAKAIQDLPRIRQLNLLQEFMGTIVLYQGKQGPSSRNYAWAYNSSPPRIAFNPHWIRDVEESVKGFITNGENYAEGFILDMLLHELTHLVVWRFHRGRGHGREWKTWARVCGFSPFGSTKEQKRLRTSRIWREHLSPREEELRPAAASSGSQEGSFPTAAALCRARLRTGTPHTEILSEIRESFPSYRALGICISTYTRELQRKGLLP